MAVLKASVGAALLVASILAASQAKSADPAELAYQKSQAAIGNRIGAHVLTDMHGDRLALGELTDRPLVISLVYTSCGAVCPIVTETLRDRVLGARSALGAESFNVLTFGFDASGDGPEQLRGFATTHRIADQPRWHVASADPATTKALLRELGFSYDDVAGGFQHVTQTSIVDPDGRVYRQVYGEDFPLPVLLEPLKELVLGKSLPSLQPEDLWKRIRFLCTSYDPTTGAYRFDYAIFFGIFFGGASLLIMAIIILRLWAERRRGLGAGPATPTKTGRPA